jgi:4-alpha-glucanotransferase
MENNKYSGILCHITSLPTAYGVGDFGPVAYDFIDQLFKANQSYWQILPIGKTDDSGCPYATDSAFGCADYYISPDFLIKEYNLNSTIFNQYFVNTDRVDFRLARENKQKMLETAFLKFSPEESYRQFLLQEKYWIEDYAIFRSLSDYRGPLWREWGTAPLSSKENERVNFHKFCQFTSFSQLAKLKKYANQKKIKLIGDLPIFVSYNSMDVWKNPHQFFLNKNFDMEFATGAAPDAFSETGQTWGTPIYDWNYQKQNNYEWWNERLSFLKRYFDVIRIDHFRGFCETSAIDASAGHWYQGPGADLFKNLHDSPEIIAEDLGFITFDVDELRNQLNFPGMRVFQFLLGGSDNPHKLVNYHYNSVAYSGTHDCDTLVGWFQGLSPEDQMAVESELKIQKPDHWAMLKILLATPSKLVLIQIQDLLGFGNEARFNYPGTVQDLNWTWKMKPEDLKKIDWEKLKNETIESGRAK